MSDLLTKVLLDENEFQKVIHWLLKNDSAVQKHGISPIEFARYFLEFLRRHTRILLPTPEQCSRDAPRDSQGLLLAPIRCYSPPDRSQNSQNFNSTFDSSYSTPVKTNFSTPSGSNYTSPLLSSRTSTPFSSTGHNTSDGSSLHSLNCSSSSIQLLEKRLTSKDTKQFSLEDFIVTKEKQSKLKKKKRAALMTCDVRSPKNDKSNDEIRKPPTEYLVVKDEIIPPGSADKFQNVGNSSAPKPLHLHNQLIRKLALLYSAMIASNLIQNLLKELNYLMSLLTSETNTPKSEISNGQFNCQCTEASLKEMFLPFTKEICLFKTRSDGVYFVCVVFENQWDLLKYLNKSTLQTLSEMPLVTACVPEFTNKIRNFVKEVKPDTQNINILNREVLSETVKFQMDTDCRSNYANDELFYAFKKQRDEFYSLLHEWEDNYQRQSSSIEFFKSRHRRLRQIFSASSDCTNMFRLADLFVSQILASVFNENVENCEKLSASGVPLTKFDLLNRRFVTPCSIVVGLEKRFPGVQEFFKDFLRSSSENAFFLCHVRDSLVQRIISFNNFQFSCDVSVALERQELFLVCINKLCLLAKFLSLITFLPYQDRHDLPLHRRIPFAEARKDVSPPLDLDRYLTVSVKTGRMVVTIPWIVEFLNGIDKTSILLPYYKKLFAKLQYLLYKIKLPAADKTVDNIFILCSNDEKHLLEDVDVSGTQKQSIKANIVSAKQIRELAARTENDFSRRFAEECLQTINCAQILITLYVNSLFNNLLQSTTIITIEDISSLKDVRVAMSSEFYIGETTLYQCCPQLHEIKSLLQNGNKLSYKSVIPQTEKTFCEQPNPKISTDIIMEAHLFSNMPKTIKSCVDFVAERIASNCVKEVCKKLIPEIKAILNQELRKGKKNQKGEEDMDSILVSFYITLKHGVKKQLAIFCKNIETGLRALIETEVPEEGVINICVDIACRKCIEIVYNWIFNYINFHDMLAKERTAINEEAERPNASASKLADDRKSKKSKSDSMKNDFDEWVEKKDANGLHSALPPVNMLHNMRHLIRRVTGVMEYNGEGKPTQEEIIVVLTDIIDSLETRSDLQFIAFRRMLMISLEVIFVLVFHCPQLIDDTLLQKFCQLWSYRKVCRIHLTFELILSSRNVDLLSNLPENELLHVKHALITFLVFTINNNLLHVSRLYSQLLKLLRRSWPPKVLKNVSKCLKLVLSSCNCGHEKINCAINWIADYIEEDDFV